jgi:hypothetical protein
LGRQLRAYGISIVGPGARPLYVTGCLVNKHVC